MKKKLISLLLVMAMVLTLPSTTVLAATTVYKVAITMTAPEVGNPLPTDAKTSDANTEVTEVKWYGNTDSNGNIVAGTEYTATITVKIKNGADAKFGGTVKATVNGTSAFVKKVTRITNNMVKVSYTYSSTQPSPTPVPPDSILSIKLTMTAPTVGKPLPTTAKTSSTASCEVTDVTWSGATDENGNMAYDTAYTAVFTVKIKEGKNAKFSTKTESIVKNASLNGEYKGFTSAERVSDTVVKLTYELAAVKKLSTISKLDNINLIKPSVGYAPDKSGYTNNSAKIKVTDTKWSGEVDNYGLAIAGVSYSYTFTVEIKPEYDLTFADTLKGSVASISSGVKVERVSDKKAIVTYTFAPVEEKVDKEAEAELKRRWSLAEADANYPLGDPITLVVNKDTVSAWDLEEMLDLYYMGHLGSNVYSALVETSDYHTLDGRVIKWKDYPQLTSTSLWQKYPKYQVTRIVYDLWFPSDYSLVWSPNVKEIWLSPNCDIQGILNNIAREVYDKGSDHFTFYTYDHVLFIPESAYPNGPTYNTDAKGIPGCRVMLYSGDDVYAAAKKGASAAKDWCTNHTYTAELFTPDRLYTYGSCQNHTLFYYSCSKCGKCEYNPKHLCVYTPLYMLNSGKKLTLDTPANYACSYHTYTVSDEHFLGINAQGDRVYLKACEWCGKDQKQTDLAITHDYYKNVMGMDDSDPSYYQLYMESVKKSWSPGGTAYNMRMKATPGDDYLDGYVVEADKFVTAKTSSYATQGIQVASNDNLIDKALLGNDYTKTITRLQLCSIAVKMAEQMLGKAITPAASGTFTDTDNEYVRKAYAAGITGSGSTAFQPNGTVDRQTMATFLYRALMYVKANSDTEYTVYDSKLSGYTDAGQIADWARQAMDFMTGLGLIDGTTDTTLSPKGSCTIEQVLLVADYSLDAGVIGWYQLNKVPTMNGFIDFVYGDRIWITSSKGTFINRYGRESKIGKFASFWAIKDR